MKVLVTGATGFLGSEICRQVTAAGHALRVLVRRTSKLDGLAGLDVERVEGDILEPSSLDRAIAGVDAVIHAAGNVGARRRDRDLVYRVNVEGTQNVLAAARRRGGLRFVHTSSVVAVGTRHAPELMDEGTEFNASNTGYHYIDAKRQGELLALEAAAAGMEVVVLNPGTILGPGDVYFTSTRFVLEYVSGKLRLYPRGGMPYCDVRDVAAAHVAALTRGERGHRYIVAGQNKTWRELLESLHALTDLGAPRPLPRALAIVAATLSDAVSTVSPHPFEDVNRPTVDYADRFHFFDCRKAERALGYQSRSLEESLRDTLADFIARGVIEASTPKLRELASSLSNLAIRTGTEGAER